MNRTKRLLQSSSFWILNKYLVKALGLERAYMLTVLTEGQELFGAEEGEGWFFQTIEMIEEITSFKEAKQRRLVNELIEIGILEKKNIGIPQKRYFRINDSKVFELLDTEITPINLKKEKKEKKELNISFDKFWNFYDVKKGKKTSEIAWKKLSDRDRIDIMNFIPKYKKRYDKEFLKYPTNFIKNRVWEDEIVERQKKEITITRW